MSLNLDKSTWTRVRFGDVAVSSKEKVDPTDGSVEHYVAGEHMDTNDLQIHRWGNVSEKDLGPAFHRRFRPGQILYGSRRTYLRKVSVADFDGVCANTTFVVETADHTLLLQEFLPFVMSSEPFHAHAIGESKGSVNPYVNWSDIVKFEFTLPPLDEQKRIADLMWAVERHKVSLRALETAASSGSSRVIEDARRRTEITKCVSDVAKVRNGQNFPTRLQGREAGDIPFFKVADLDRPGNERYLTNPGNWIAESDLEDLGAKPYPAGSVVTARVGAAIRLERRRALPCPSFVDENHLVILPNSINPKYLLAVLAETRLARRGNDGVVPSLNQKIVGAVEIPSVSAEEEQRIAEIYHEVLDARDRCYDEIRALATLRTVMLAEVFGGC